MIGRASPQKAWTAIWFFLHDRGPRRNRRRPKRISRTKHANDWKPHRRRHMHRARVIANENVASRQQCRQIGNRRFSGQINRRAPHPRNNRRRNRRLPRRAKQNNLGIRFRHQSIRYLREPIRRPTFRRSIRSPRANRNAHRIRTHPSRAQSFLRRITRRLSNPERNLAFTLQPLHPTNPPQQFQIIKLLMRRNLTHQRYRHRLGQQNTPAIPRIPNPLRDPRTPSQPSRIEGVLQQQSHIKFAIAQQPHEPLAPRPALFRPARVVSNQLIANTLIAIDICNIRPRHNRHLRARKFPAYRTQRRHRHNRVAHPIRRANQDSQAAPPRLSRNTRSIAATNSVSAEKTKSITATHTGRRNFRPTRFAASFSVVTKPGAEALSASASNRSTSASEYA